MRVVTENKEGHVYLLHAVGTNRYKIGMTQQGRMAKRFNELNGSQSAFPVELVTFIDVKDRYQVEAELHQKFKAFRVHGEWFNLPRGSKEVERVMGQYGDIRDKSSFENWRILTLIAGIIILLFAWQSYQGDRARQEIYRPTIENLQD